MVEIPITLLADEKGYFDRECPRCESVFKIYMIDWKEKVNDEEVHCPKCGCTESADKMWTQEQVAGMKEIIASWALNHITNELGKSFRSLENSTKGNRHFQIKYKPGKKITFSNNPIGQRDEWELEISCPECSTKYSTIGPAYFCPCCRHNPIIETFEKSILRIERMISSLPEMNEAFTKITSKTEANDMTDAMLEKTVGEIVSVFQHYASYLHENFTGKKSRTNDFQIIKKGSDLFNNGTGYGYCAFIDEEELIYLNTMFQKRHLLEHNGGYVDTKYLEKTGDKYYKDGQRLVLHESEVLRFCSIVQKLGEGLKTIKARS
jgi:hypothetical protein